MANEAIGKAKEHFGALMRDQLERVERMKAGDEWVDFSAIKPIKIGVLGGDGIGPYIAAEAQRVMETLLEPEIASGKVEIDVIEGLTIENRADHGKAIPDDVLAEIRNTTSRSRARPRPRAREIRGPTSRAPTSP